MELSSSPKSGSEDRPRRANKFVVGGLLAIGAVTGAVQSACSYFIDKKSTTGETRNGVANYCVYAPNTNQPPGAEVMLQNRFREVARDECLGGAPVRITKQTSDEICFTCAADSGIIKTRR